MRKNGLYFAHIFLLFSFFGCGSIQKMAVGTTASILREGSKEIETERDWDVFKQALPASIKTMEALLYVSPDNEDLLSSLVKGYTAFAYGINETLYLNDYYAENDSTYYKSKAESQYSRAVSYGLRFLKNEGVSYDDLSNALSNGGEKSIAKLLGDELSDDQKTLEMVLFTAQAWGGLINLKKSIPLMAQAPIIKGMFDWVCSEDPKILFGICDVLLAVYDLGRPKTFGGNPQRGRKSLLKFIDQNPENYMARVTLMQFWSIPSSDKKSFDSHSRFLTTAGREFGKKKHWEPSNQPPKMSRQNLFNAIALKRFKIMRKYEKEFF